LGIATVGGLLASQVLTLYTTPVVFLLVDRLVSRRRRAALTRSKHSAESLAPAKSS
jgi:hypothetical protein